MKPWLICAVVLALLAWAYEAIVGALDAPEADW